MSQKCFPPPFPLGMPDPIPDPVGWIAEKTSKWMTRRIAELIIGDKRGYTIGKKRKDDDDD